MPTSLHPLAKPIPPGTVFGLLSTTGEWRRVGRHLEWLCECKCGSKVWRRGAYLRINNRRVQSCGCANRWGWGLWREPNGSPVWWEQRLDSGSKHYKSTRWRILRELTDPLRESRFASHLPSPECVLIARELRAEVLAVLARLRDRECETITRRFGIGCDEMTLEEVGELFGITREGVRQCEEKALRHLRSSIGVRLRKYLPEAEDRARHEWEEAVAAVLAHDARHASPAARRRVFQGSEGRGTGQNAASVEKTS